MNIAMFAAWLTVLTPFLIPSVQGQKGMMMMMMGSSAPSMAPTESAFPSTSAAPSGSLKGSGSSGKKSGSAASIFGSSKGGKKQKRQEESGVTAELILLLRNIADPLGEIVPNTDVAQFDTNADGVLDLSDALNFIETALTTVPMEEIFPEGTMDDFLASLVQPDDGGRRSRKLVAPGSGTYNSYALGPEVSRPPVTFDFGSFARDVSQSPGAYDYMIYVVITDAAGANTTILLSLLTRNVWVTIGAALFTAAIRAFLQNRIGNAEGLDALRHYLGNTGTDFMIDYSKAISEDSSISSTYMVETREAFDAARALRPDENTSSYSFHKTTMRGVSSSTTTWLAALGSHVIWSTGDVQYDSGACELSVELSTFALDWYNFDDTSTSRAIQGFGRLAVLGWAQPFFTTGSIDTTETIDLQCCEDSDCPSAGSFMCNCNLCEAACPTTQVSGGQGFTTFTVDLKATNGSFPVFYNMFTIPDQLTLRYEGVTIFDHGSPVSGSRSFDQTFGSATSVSSSVTVELNAPNSGTAWNVEIGCAL